MNEEKQQDVSPPLSPEDRYKKVHGLKVKALKGQRVKDLEWQHENFPGLEMLVTSESAPQQAPKKGA